MSGNSKTINKQILIVGGGVAGASLAIRLAKKGLEVLVVEKDKFPRHKLCGEFVSPECLLHFESLGVLDSMQEIEGESIRETRFFSENGNGVSVPSEWFYNGEQGALGISRSEMDFRLLQKASECGAEVLENSRFIGISIENEQIRAVAVKNNLGEMTRIKAKLIIDATGRARVLGKCVEKEWNIKPRKSKIKHVAFKSHFKNVKLQRGICEIYFFRGGYGGLNFVENGVANHCFLIDSSVVREFNGDADQILEKVVFQNKQAFEALKNARREFDWLAVSVEKFGRQPISDIRNLVAIGDAEAFIDPFTGSGMLMALESSGILANAITRTQDAFGNKEIRIIKADYENMHRKATKRRLRVCSIIRNLSFSPRLAGVIISAAKLSNSLLRRFASTTRPARNL